MPTAKVVVPLNLMWCIRELMTAIRLLASTFRFPLSASTGATELELLQQLKDNLYWHPIVFGSSTAVALNACIRYTVFISLSEKVGG